MRGYKVGSRLAACLAVIALCLVATALPLGEAEAVTASPFASLAGWWTGEGMLGFKASPPERVKCRATYFLNDAQDELKQNIRCVTASGGIEVLSNIKDTADTLSGHWKETTHNYEGDLTGEVTPKGFRIKVIGTDISANMDVVVKENKQVIEIQFINASLIGLTLVMTKG